MKIEVGSTNVILGCSFEYDDGSVHYRSLPVNLPGTQAYEPYRWFTVSPGYSSAALRSIVVTLPEEGMYGYEDLSVIAQPMSAYDTWVATLTENVMENVDMHYLSYETAATSRITGEITLDQPKILCTQIPYSKGWSVRVDGKRASLLQVNVILSGVELSAGHHTIELTYETPGLLVGSSLSLAGLVCLVVIALLERRCASSRYTQSAAES